MQKPTKSAIYEETVRVASPLAQPHEQWPVLHLPDPKNRGEFVPHAIKRKMGF